MPNYPEPTDLRPLDTAEYPGETGTIDLVLTIKRAVTTPDDPANYVWLNCEPSAVAEDPATHFRLKLTYNGTAAWRQKVFFTPADGTSKIVSIAYESKPQRGVEFWADQSTGEATPEPRDRDPRQPVRVGSNQEGRFTQIDFFVDAPEAKRSVRPIPIVVDTPARAVVFGHENFECGVEVDTLIRPEDGVPNPNNVLIDTSHRYLLVPVDPQSGEPTNWPFVLTFEKQRASFTVRTVDGDLPANGKVYIYAFINDDPKDGKAVYGQGKSGKVLVK